MHRAKTRAQAVEDVRWAMGFLSYIAAGARDDCWDEVRDRARQHARELAEAVGLLDGGDEAGPPCDPRETIDEVRTFLGAKAPALAGRFEHALLHQDDGMREVAPCQCEPAGGVDLAAIAREILPGGHVTLTIYGPPDR